MKAETPGTSDVEAALDQAAEDYISLLIGLLNALPKPKKGGDSKDGGKGDEVDELALEMESEGGMPPGFPCMQVLMQHPSGAAHMTLEVSC